MPLDEILRALSDPTRREILRLLRGGDLNAGAIADHFPLAKSTLSAHFQVLRQAGLIVSERRGTHIRYSLSAGALEEALAAILETLHIGSPKERSS